MATKKAAPKKTAAKKPVAKKAPAKPKAVKKAKVELTEFEQDLMAKIAKMDKDGYRIQVQCEGRTKLADPGEDLLEYIRDNNPYQVVGFKSGSKAICYGIK